VEQHTQTTTMGVELCYANDSCEVVSSAIGNLICTAEATEGGACQPKYQNGAFLQSEQHNDVK
jgi:hypothetical protein